VGSSLDYHLPTKPNPKPSANEVDNGAPLPTTRIALGIVGEGMGVLKTTGVPVPERTQLDGVRTIHVYDPISYLFLAKFCLIYPRLH